MPKKAQNILSKSVDVEVAPNGTITGYAATWIREPDSWGDVVAKGAFAESIAAIEAEGRVLPLLWNHEAGDLRSFIGKVTGLSEDERGLLFTAEFDGTERAQRARELALDGRLAKFSFAYDVLDQGTVTLDDGREANELRKLDIHEVSLVMYPANPDTGVVEVKGAPAPEGKAGRRNSKSDEETIRQAIGLLQSLLNDGPDGEPGEQDDPADADETDDPAKGGEGAAAPEGREVDEKSRLEAYKAALAAAYGNSESKD